MNRFFKLGYRRINTAFGLCACSAVALFALAGCDRTVVVRGQVSDVGQRALPGVAVVVSGAGYDTVTDALGHYELRCAPGPVTLEYLKTGYTPGRLEFPEVGEQGALRIRFVDATGMVLWPLPPGKGVFVFDRTSVRYAETTPAQTRSYLSSEGGSAYGLQTEPELKLETGTPFLAVHKLPAFDVALSKLRRIRASLPQTMAATNFDETVWIRQADIPLVALPIDEPGQLLIELRLSAPLEPGIYAVHWGALQGQTATEARAFLFEVVAPKSAEATVGIEGEAPPAKDTPKAAQEGEAAPKKAKHDKPASSEGEHPKKAKENPPAPEKKP